MRIESFVISNYKGVRHAELTGLAQEPIVVLTGKNGTGKSLVLEALVWAWTTRYDGRDRVGPWADSMSVDLTVCLTDTEIATLNDWSVKATGPPVPDDTSTFTVTRARHKYSGSETHHASHHANVLRQDAFQRENPFAIIDFLPAARQITLGGQPTVDLRMLSAERMTQERFGLLDNFMNNRGFVQLNNVNSYLVSLDYQNLLAAREGKAATDDFAAITGPFLSATTKEIHLPAHDSVRGSHIDVSLPSGEIHDLMDLSSGEQELLALSYFVRRLNATGGILCLDEPEQHLHPSLQAILLSSMTSLAESSQIIVVSHSAPLISSAPASGLIEISPPHPTGTNQAIRAPDQDARVALIAQLGLSVSDLVQVDAVLIVEGEHDYRVLSEMFPAAITRTRVLIAGSGDQVIDACHTLTQGNGLLGLPWMAVRDRDFLSDTQVADFQARFPELLIWPAREIESILLDSDLLAFTLTMVGRNTSRADAEQLLADAADPLSDEVALELAQAEIRRRYPPPESGNTGTRWDQLEKEFHDYAAVNSAGAAFVQTAKSLAEAEIGVRWPTDRLRLADPKIVFKRLFAAVQTFKNVDAMESAMIAVARDRPDVLPAPFKSFLTNSRRS